MFLISSWIECFHTVRASWPLNPQGQAGYSCFHFFPEAHGLLPPSPAFLTVLASSLVLTSLGNCSYIPRQIHIQSLQHPLPYFPENKQCSYFSFQNFIIIHCRIEFWFKKKYDQTKKIAKFKKHTIFGKTIFLSNFKFTAILRQYKTFPHNPFYHLYNILVHIVPSLHSLPL